MLLFSEPRIETTSQTKPDLTLEYRSLINVSVKTITSWYELHMTQETKFLILELGPHILVEDKILTAILKQHKSIPHDMVKWSEFESKWKS